MKYFHLLVFILLIHVKNIAFAQEPKFYKIIPSEIKYGSFTNHSFQNYYSDLSISYFILELHKEFHGDGFNTHFFIGSSLRYFNKSFYLSIFPYVGKVTWWSANFGFRVEPMFDLNQFKISHLNTELSVGLIANLSISVYTPLQKSEPFFLGLKYGLLVPKGLINKELHRKKAQ
jgi:hypothetical protein